MERFWSKVLLTTEDNCWNWQAAIGSGGYGRFKIGGKTLDAHRFSWILAHGSVPENMLICHSCDNRLCVNPKHLFLGSYKDNHQDAVVKGRIIPKKELKHPSLSAYQRRKCRCEECRKIGAADIKRKTEARKLKIKCIVV